VFIDKHRSDSVRFGFPTDGHWNELAHRLVAERIRKTALFDRLSVTGRGAPTNALFSGRHINRIEADGSGV
jgi:hypothetical protein